MNDPGADAPFGVAPEVEAALRGRGLGLAILDVTDALIVVLDREARIVAFNKAAERSTGLRAADLVGEPVWDLLPDEEAPPVREVFESLRAGDYPNQFENRWVAADGSLRLIAWSNTALSDQDGNVDYVIGTGIDITSHAEAEAELQSTLAALEKRTAEMGELVVAAHAMQGRDRFDECARTIFDSARRAIGAQAGYVALLSDDGTENEVVFLEPGGIPCTVDPTLPMPIRGLREVAYRTGEPAWENDFASSGWVRFMPRGHAPLDNVMFAPLVMDGATVGLIGLANKPGGFTDDDARTAAGFGEMAAVALRSTRVLEKLKASEERFRSLAESAADAIVCSDEDGRITYWNEAAESIFGLPAASVIGGSVTRIMPERHRDAHSAAMARVVKTRPSLLMGGGTVEIEGLRADGTEFPVELSLSSWKSREGVSFTAIIRDVTERKRAEEALARAYEAEHRIAETLQASLLSAIDTIEGLDVGAVYVPAHAASSVGGDFYDAFELDGGLVAILVGDVAGKGVEAAGLTLSVRSAVRTVAEMDPSPAMILRRTCATLTRQLSPGMFVTALVAVLDPRAGEVSIASAGHPCPLIHGARPRILELWTGPALGIMECDYPEQRFMIAEDECLLLYTDGLSDARFEGRLFGEEGILAAASELAEPTPQELADHVLEAARRHAKGTLQDDVAIVAARLAHAPVAVGQPTRRARSRPGVARG